LIEIDDKLIPILNKTLASYDNVKILNTDVMKTDLDEIIREESDGKKVKIVANLPYYITTPILMKILRGHVDYESITVMVQKEVALRMQAQPGNKDYGALSLAVQYYSEPEIVVMAPPHCFIPQPKVASAVIRMKFHEEPPVDTDDPKFMFRVIRASFNQRRKTLANGLKNGSGIPISKEAIQEAIEEAGYPLTVRGETLTLQEFADLSKILKQKIS
jgi:16S rRNA (adenine1518-N6/adenine1519-N6)-dimethyltransferase